MVYACMHAVCVHLCVGGWCMHAMCVCERGRGILFHSTLHTCTYQIMYCYSRKKIIAMFAPLIRLSRSVGALFSFVICVVKSYQAWFLFLDGKKMRILTAVLVFNKMSFDHQLLFVVGSCDD